MNNVAHVIDQVRGEHKFDLNTLAYQLGAKERRVLVTGAGGHIGQPLVELLRANGVKVVPTDVDTSAPWGCTYMDVTKFQSVLEVVAFHDPSLIIHLAGAKHAPDGEVNPWSVADVNVLGTRNVLNVGRRVVLASTCKAIAPETAYGASKLLAERMVLNQGGSVARFYNVPECGPNVIDTWRATEGDLPVTPCARYLITKREALGLTLHASLLEPGRYKVDAGEPWTMELFAALLFPGRGRIAMAPRRGDRLVEPERGENEWIENTGVNGIDKVGSWHDQQG